MCQEHFNVSRNSSNPKRVKCPDFVPEYIVSPAVHVTKIPKELPPAEAAPLLCGRCWNFVLLFFLPVNANSIGIAGIAMYSSIKKTKTRPGDWLVIPGAGGGLGHMYVTLICSIPIYRTF